MFKSVNYDGGFLLGEEAQGGKLRVDPFGPVHAEAQFSDFDKIQMGDEAEFYRTITAEDVEDFARLSGDRNPMHMDEQFAGRTRFQRRVVHGMLLASYVSTLVGMHCPGPGALWSQQNFCWAAPVFIDDRIHFRIRVTHKSTGARALTIKVTGVNQDGKVIMEGAGTVTVLEERQQRRDLSITERVAFVSDASSEIGVAIASMLGQAGAVVVVNCHDNAVAAEELSAKIESTGGRALPTQADITDSASVVTTVQKVRAKFDRPISLLINSAGNTPQPRAFVETGWNDVQSMLDVHLRAAFNCCQAIIPGMVEQKSGRIINIGSAFTRNTPPSNWSSFLIAKSAMQALTRCLAVELGPHGIRVNMVSPGLMDNDATTGLPDRLRKVQAMQTPLRRLASPNEIAAVISALCSEAGDFVTGIEIPVCRGLQM